MILPVIDVLLRSTSVRIWRRWA